MNILREWKRNLRLFTGIAGMIIMMLLTGKTAFAEGGGSVTVKNRRGDIMCQKSGAEIESSDTVFFYLNETYLSEKEIFASMISFDGGDTYTAVTEVTGNSMSVTPQAGKDIVVRFYICAEGDYRAEEQVRSPSDGEQIYTVRYAAKKAESILAELNGNAAGQKDGTEYYSGNMPLLKIYPSDTREIYVTVDDGRKTEEYTVKDRILSMKLKEGTYKLDVFTIAESGRIHAQGFPRTVCYDAKAPSIPSFTVHMPEDGGYYPELKKYQYYASGSLTVSVQSSDKGSGVEHIYMRSGNGEIRETDSMQIMAPFSGTVYARSVDRAGNATAWVQCGENIQVESRAPEMTFNAEQKDEKLRISGRITDESGIGGVEITCDGDVMLSYRFENGKQLFKEKEFSLFCPAARDRYRERKIQITASDIAGNHAKKQITAGQSDTVAPLISMEGCGDYDVTGEDVYMRFFVADDNLKASSVAGEAVRMDVDGKAAETLPLTFPESVFTKEGNYDVTVRAEDMSGNKAQRTWNFRIDKTAPVIRGIEKYNGKIFKDFRLTDRLETLVSDISGVTYRVYLNGRDFDENSIVSEPGTYVLRVTAEDEAGNGSACQAQFTVGERTEENEEKAEKDEKITEFATPDEKEIVTAQNGSVSSGRGTNKRGITLQQEENAFRNMVPFVAAAGIVFLLLLGTVFYFVRNARLTQNTGCDRLNS